MPPGLEGSGFSALRLLLWLPYCGLFVSLFFPVGGDDTVDLLRYLGLVAGTAAIGVAIAVNLIYRGAVFTSRFVKPGDGSLRLDHARPGNALCRHWHKIKW